MIAMVMCAGEGTRLRPLTLERPKPLMPLANKPVLQYTLENLRKHGITEVVVNVSYLGDQIRNHFKDGAALGMKIHYSPEEKPWGTAGGVKRAESYFLKHDDPDFLITSGDGLTDIDFARVVREHKKKKALGTMVLKRVDQRFEYGVTLTDSKGRIKKFVEKPLFGDFFSNQVNTGIYIFHRDIFKHIPAKTFYDFGKQVWPELLKKKKLIYGVETDCFWTDIGNIPEYRRAQRMLMEGTSGLHLDGIEVAPRVRVGKNCSIDPSARLEGPCLIGDDCTIGKNATIGNYAELGSGSSVGANALVTQSILWEKVQVATGAKLENCIVGKGVKVPKDLALNDGILLK